VQVFDEFTFFSFVPFNKARHKYKNCTVSFE
jgi:hypothetical protein